MYDIFLFIIDGFLQNTIFVECLYVCSAMFTATISRILLIEKIVVCKSYFSNF